MIASVLLLASGCGLIDQAAEGWLVLRHYQELERREKERRLQSRGDPGAVVTHLSGDN